MRVVEAIVLSLLIARVLVAAAEPVDVKVVQPKDTLAASDVAKILGAAPESGSLPKTRSIRKAASERESSPSTLALRVQFAVESAEIPADAHAQLDAVAAGIRELPGEPRVLIEGHTDSAGRDDYNDQLSLKRAVSVRDYLVAHGVRADGLEVTGAGRRVPLTPDEGRAAVNRRVEFRRIN